MPDRIRARRRLEAWSQQELADRAGLTRQLVSAVEAGRNVPGVAAALALARALGTSVEDLFGTERTDAASVFGEPLQLGRAVVTGRVGDRLVAADVEHGIASNEFWALSDAIVTDEGLSFLPGGEDGGLVIAGCDPILGTLAGLVARKSPHRVVAVHASTGRSVQALGAGTVHGVIVHARAGDLPEPPVVVRRWHLARWQVGLASRQPGGPPSIEELAARRHRIVQRDAGAGSQRALERALREVGSSGPVPGPLAEGHLDAARRVAQGRAAAGVTIAPAAGALGLGFAPLEEHDVELWIDARWADLPATTSLVNLLGSSSVADRVAHLTGYDAAEIGAERHAS